MLLINAKTNSKGITGAEIISKCLPVEDPFHIKKPFQRLCCFAALIPAGLKMVTRLYYDLAFVGLPQDLTDGILMATYYIGDVASFLIGYFVLLYVLQLFYTDETKRRIEFES